MDANKREYKFWFSSNATLLIALPVFIGVYSRFFLSIFTTLKSTSTIQSGGVHQGSVTRKSGVGVLAGRGRSHPPVDRPLVRDQENE